MLSIIIPYYKITFFDETMQSLANQTNKDFKVFIGDDNSKNPPLQLLEKYKNDFQFKYTRFDVNFGSINLVQQWNRCVKLDDTQNKWLMILGDDDVLQNNVVEEFYNQKSNFEDAINVVRFSTIKINEKSEFISDRYENPINENSIDFFFRETRSSLSEYVFGKEKLLKTGFKNFPLAWHSDVLAVLEVSNFNKIYSINEAAVQIRISTQSISGSLDNTNKKLQATFQFYYYLLCNKNKFFTYNQREVLLNCLKNSYFHRKKSMLHFFKISYIYIKYFSINEYLKFLNSFCLKIKK